MKESGTCHLQKPLPVAQVYENENQWERVEERITFLKCFVLIIMTDILGKDSQAVELSHYVSGQTHFPQDRWLKNTGKAHWEYSLIKLTRWKRGTEDEMEMGGEKKALSTTYLPSDL